MAIVLVALAVVLAGLAWALCYAAGRADERMEKQYEELRKNAFFRLMKDE